MFKWIRLWYWKKKYRVGANLTRFVAKDIRRDVEVTDASEIDAGVITARTRTWNLLYAARGLKEKPSFGSVRRIRIDNLWDWEGELWGGPVPDTTDE